MESDVVVHPTNSSLYSGGEVGKGTSDATRARLPPSLILSLLRSVSALSQFVHFYSPSLNITAADSQQFKIWCSLLSGALKWGLFLVVVECVVEKMHKLWKYIL